MKIGVIGTAGRQEAGLKLNYNHWLFMSNTVRRITKPGDILVSGGAAWADHVAVHTWLEFQKELKLFLYLPCKWDAAKHQFLDTNVRDYKQNPGGTSNYYHKLFSPKVNFNSLEEINTCYKLQQETRQVVIFDNGKGFFDRNIQVGKVDVLLAFTFNNANIPADGGTLHTWKYSTAAEKIHFDLNKVKS